MHIIRDLTELPAEAYGGAVTIGNFDGVHQGHQVIIRQLLRRAKEVSGPAIVFTFDPHPVRILRPDESPPPLTWTRRKAALLQEFGVDWVVAYPTDRALLELTAEDFFQKIMVEALAARAMVEGPNFFFGHNREGTITRLRQLTTKANISLDIVQAEASSNAEMVSSSRIRTGISKGEVAQAAALLGRPYRIRGMVTHGAGRGKQLGFPTANLDAIDTLLPAHGVYAGRAITEDKKIYPAAINIGPNPTFGEDRPKVEVHLIGSQVALYGEVLEVDFTKRIRGVVSFGSKAQLIAQLKRDVVEAADCFKE